MKPLSFHPKVFKILGWLAPVLLIMGITAGLVSGTWGIVPVGLLIAGGVCLLLWLLAYWRSLPKFFDQRSTQAGTNAVVATLAVIVIIGVINFLTVRYSTRTDLTENQIFTLSPQTQEVVSELELPTKVWVFWDENVAPSRSDQELLENYSRESEQFTYEYADPQVDVALSRDFGVQSMGEVHLQMGDSRRLVQVINEQAGLSERQLTNAIVQSTSDRQLTAYILQGHGERDLSQEQGGISEAIALLESENYQIEPLNLTEQGSVPEEADVVIIAGPQRPLLAGEVSALQDFSQQTGGLMLLIDPDTDPGLDPILEDWGVELNDLLVLDSTAESLQLGLTTALAQNYGDHPITQDFAGGISFYPEAQVVELTQNSESDEPLDEAATDDTETPLEDAPEADSEAAVDDVDTANAPESAPLLLTSEQTQAFEIPEDGNIRLEEPPVVEGPLVLGVALNRSVEANTAETEAAVDAEPADGTTETSQSPENELEEEVDAAEPEETEPEETDPEDIAIEEAEDSTASEARLVVIGNSTFVTNGLVNQQLNGDVFLNSVAWLSQNEEQSLSIRPKEMTNRRLLLEPGQWWILVLSSVVILPLLGIGGAIFIWLRRR